MHVLSEGTPVHSEIMKELLFVCETGPETGWLKQPLLLRDPALQVGNAEIRRQLLSWCRQSGTAW